MASRDDKIRLEKAEDNGAFKTPHLPCYKNCAGRDEPTQHEDENSFQLGKRTVGPVDLELLN